MTTSKRELFLLVPSKDVAGEAARWWGSGGAELMDEVDPACKTEDLMPIRVTEEQIESFWDRARSLPGWEHTGIRLVGRIERRPGAFSDTILASCRETRLERD